MTYLRAASQIFRRIVVAVANRTTRKARRYLYKLKMEAICRQARIVAPDLVQSFSGHVFEGGSKEFTLFGNDIAEAAERIAQGSFVLFGAWVEMPETLRRSDARWHTDFLSGVRFDLADYTDLRPKTEVADIKVPWEYGRMHRLIPLAATFGAKGDRRFLNLYRDEVEGFYDANPLGRGVQWVCTMEVGIRAFNLLASYELLRNMLPVDDELHELIAEMAICHGEHIWANLETSARLQENNHYIADLLGLAAIVSCFPDAPKSKKWGRYVRRELLRCVRKQVLDDGCCFERSTRYTRLVGEVLFYAGKALTSTPYELAPEYFERLALLGEFLEAVTNSHEDSLQLGDNDSGRAVCIAPAGYNDLRLVGRLVARERGVKISSALFPEEELLYGADARVDEVPVWGDGAKVFFEAGVALARLQGWSLGFYASDGFEGGAEAGHTHNDKLSLTLDVDGVSFFVDPGSGVYTRDTTLRNRLRSTSQHSTLWFEGIEQNELSTLFGFVRCGGASLAVVKAPHGKIAFEGSTDCWRNRIGVVHKREILVDFNHMQVIDSLEGGEPSLPAYRSLVLAPSVTVESQSETVVILSSCGVTVQLKSNAEFTVREGLYSARYGSVEKTLILDTPFVMGETNVIRVNRNNNDV